MPDCDKCEELLQPYLDRELNDGERAEAEAHLARLLRTARGATASRRSCACSSAQVTDEPMPHELDERLAALRIAL